MTPIATIYQKPDGTYAIMSIVQTHLGLARVLVSLSANLLEQAASQAPQVAKQVNPDLATWMEAQARGHDGPQPGELPIPTDAPPADAT